MGLLYWRSFTHWLGGMGVLVFLLAVVDVYKRQVQAVRHMRKMQSEIKRLTSLREDELYDCLLYTSRCV